MGVVEINNPNDIIKLLKAKRLSPRNAIRLYCHMRTMVVLEFSDDEQPTINDVINQIELLEQLHKPLSFWQKQQAFSIKDIFKFNLN
jgi:exoribonuclease II